MGRLLYHNERKRMSKKPEPRLLNAQGTQEGTKSTQLQPKKQKESDSTEQILEKFLQEDTLQDHSLGKRSAEDDLKENVSPALKKLCELGHQFFTVLVDAVQEFKQDLKKELKQDLKKELKKELEDMLEEKLQFESFPRNRNRRDQSKGKIN